MTTKEDALLLLSTLASSQNLVLHVSKYPETPWTVEVSSHTQPYIKGIASEQDFGAALELATSRFITNRDTPRVVSNEKSKLSGKSAIVISLDDL